MVMDLQDAPDTLDAAMARSEIRLLGSSARGLAVGDAAPDDVADDDAESLGDAEEHDDLAGSEDDDGGDEDDEDEEEAAGWSDDDEAAGPADRGRSAPRQARRAAGAFGGAASVANEDADFADSDSDLELGEPEELGFSSQRPIPVLDDDADDDDDDDGADAPRWKADLASKALASFTQHAARRRRKDWMRLIYDSTLAPADVLRDGADAAASADAEDDDEDDDDGEFFRREAAARPAGARALGGRGSARLAPPPVHHRHGWRRRG
jgi:ribosome biogenesis protein BMS1